MQASYSINKFCSNLAYGYVEKQTDDAHTPVFKDSYGQWKMISTEINCIHKIHSIYGVDQQKDVVNLQSFFDLWAYVYKHRESLNSSESTPKDETYAQKYLSTVQEYKIDMNKNYRSSLKNQLKNQVQGPLKNMQYSSYRENVLKSKDVPFKGFLTSKKEGFWEIHTIRTFDPSLLTEGLQSYPDQSIDGETEFVTCYLKPQTKYQIRQWLNFERSTALGAAILTSIVALIYRNLNRKIDENE